MSTPYFYFDKKELQERAEHYSSAYTTATPFPHVLIDNFFPESVLEQVLEEFPSPEEISWTEFSSPAENRKLSAEDDEQMGPYTRHLLAQCNSASFLSFLEKLTGIEALIPDPYFRGGGLHQTLQGGLLGIHADFNRYKKLNLHRRINVLVYLNKNWKEEYGGHLELWETKMTHCVKKVSPVFNRFVAFSTTDTAYHGHPDPLLCPPDMSRKSIALYYYTVADRNVAPAHTTLFKERPGKDSFTQKTWRSFAKRFIPPILLDLWNVVRAR